MNAESGRSGKPPDEPGADRGRIVSETPSSRQPRATPPPGSEPQGRITQIAAIVVLVIIVALVAIVLLM